MAKERRRRVGMRAKDLGVDAVQEAALYSQVDDRATITMVARLVPYRDFAERPDGSILGVDTFRLLLAIALYDVFRERLTDEERAKAADITVEELVELRAHPVMKEVRKALLEKFSVVADSRSFDQWSEVLEDLMSREKFKIATVSWDGSTRNAAIDSFISRRSAAKPREVSVTVTVPQRLREELEAGFAYERTLLPAAGVLDAEGDIDAGKLNVPPVKLVGSGATQAADEE